MLSAQNHITFDSIFKTFDTWKLLYLNLVTNTVCGSM